ncbi:MAG TPA: hypothetical protein VMR34_02915 [Candidatus Saccharimonadales bacterium]|nr:hypothetical protein [Candidatus Saccharimonadales bacterium]
MLYEGKNKAPETDRVETLRLILENEQNRSISYAEAQEIADSLISFYEILGDKTSCVDEFIDADPVISQEAS